MVKSIWLKALAVLTEDPGLISGTQTTCNSNSGEFDDPSCFHRHANGTHRENLVNTHIHFNKNKDF